MLGSRVPVALKIFLMALAIIDDRGYRHYRAVLHQRSVDSVAERGSRGDCSPALLNIFNVRRIGIYILVGMVLWTAVLKSGVHATLAGVIVGFFAA